MFSIKILLSNIYRTIFPIKLCGNNNYISSSKNINNSRITIYGNNNVIKISNNSKINNSNIVIFGNNSSIIIGNNVDLKGPVNIHLEDNSTLTIGDNTNLRGVTITIINGKVSIGKNCMFSYNIKIRNTDSHKILDKNTMRIINANKDVKICDNVWVGEDVTILKGSHISDNCVIGYGTITTKVYPPNSVIAGIPGKIVKSNIIWKK